jgi:hypothetical protein
LEVDAQSKLKQVQKALDHNGIYLKQLDDPTVQRLRQAEKQLELMDANIRSMAEDCSKGRSCTPPSGQSTRIDVSFLPKIPIVKWQKAGSDETKVTLTSAGAVSEIYLRPSWWTNISGVPDEPNFTREVWSSKPDQEAAILAAGINRNPDNRFPEFQGFLYELDNQTSKLTASANTIAVDIRKTPGGSFGYLYIRGQAPPIEHGPDLIVNDSFGRSFTLGLKTPACPELQECSMDDLQ